ncbi:hypothetical protein [Candidatus Phycosocius spiralis]|uniref:VOC domain-containing protein n=1 Tax=Candidatus Phycosocius spiralis TaxID=2815099 RepID=A0ABQ4PZD5_9PROT|nr:hypothetical protein PsB1_2188 [Candidatus Phycosocius spiralis]
MGFLSTADFESQYQWMEEMGVTFREAPSHASDGKGVVIEDCYGHGWDFLVSARTATR